MKKLKDIFISNRLFFAFFAFFFLFGLVFLLIKGKAGAFVILNPYHQSALDTFFIYFTYLGDGIFSALVILLFLILRRWSQAIQVLAAFLLSALFAQILKNAFSMPRPKQFFAPGEYAYFIDGITHVGFASFPSGHSTSIFALATMLAILETNKKSNVFYLLVAVAVGYSRIYLGQHFLNDVLMGSTIGVITAILVHWLFAEKLDAVPAFNRSRKPRPNQNFTD
ncbi:MAG: phosphatase PAP2 family protein [Bacteroidetes bacterium]|nr:phosphatase PAP2 family protein [Bacteroidota bacterium]